MIKDIIRKEEPDFMAITGDLISGQMYDQSKENSNFWEHYFEEFFGIMNGYNIPWGFVPGYHDYETRWTNEKMQSTIEKNLLNTSLRNNFVFLD